MISAKVFAAIAVTGFGAATMGTDAYLSAAETAPAPPHREQRPPAAARRPEPVAVSVREPVPVLMLDPVTIYARIAPRARAIAPPAPPKELVVCSHWRAPESGPTGRGVRDLCMADFPTGAPPTD